MNHCIFSRNKLHWLLVFFIEPIYNMKSGKKKKFHSADCKVKSKSILSGKNKKINFNKFSIKFLKSELILY